MDISERESNIRAARVYLAEARRRRGQRFGWLLLAWAANARRRAADVKGLQRELFARP